ncbi:MAG: glycosyltransferase [bacterium]|nr:glycosyltransferase [bacterium]
MIVVAELHPVKGIDRAIEVFRRVRLALAEDLKLYIVGAGPQETALRRQCDGLAGVEFMGHLSEEEIQRLMRRCFLQLHLAFFDSNPLSVIEGCAAGLIPLVSDQTGSTDYLPRECIVPSGSVEMAVHRALGFCKAGPDGTGTLRRRLQESVAPFSDRQQMVQSFKRAIEYLANGAPKEFEEQVLLVT